MARGPKKHLKKIAAPKAWMLEKLGGIFTTRPSQGPHKLRESLPLAVLLMYLHTNSAKDSNTPRTEDKLPWSSTIRRTVLRLITDSEETKDSQLVSWMLSRSSRPRNSTDAFMTLREDSFSRALMLSKLDSNCWRLQEKLLVPTKSHTSSLTTPEPSDSPTLKSRSETPSSTTLITVKSSNGSRTTLETPVMLPEETISVESDNSNTSRDTLEDMTSSTSRMPTVRHSPPERTISSSLDQERSPWSLYQRRMVLP